MSAKQEKLEEKVAFLEAALQDLSDEHFQQQREIQQLNRQVEWLIEKVRKQSDSADGYTDSGLANNEKPPHY